MAEKRPADLDWRAQRSRAQENWAAWRRLVGIFSFADRSRTGIKAIRSYAAAAGRQVPEDHYGVLIPFYFADNAPKALEIADGRFDRARSAS